MRVLREVIAALEPLATIEPLAPYWMAYGDQGSTYCYRCGMKRVSRHRERLDGGWSQVEDGQSLCEDCGALLEHTLTQYGLEREVEVYEDLRRHDKIAGSALDACAILQVCRELDFFDEKSQRKHAGLVARARRVAERFLRAVARRGKAAS